MNSYLRVCQTCARDARRFGGYSHWLAFRCLPALIGAGLVMLLLASSTARAEGEGAVELNEVETGELLLRTDDGAYRPALLQDSEVHFSVSGMIATVKLTQRFQNDSAQFVEGVYAFPLPSEAAVRAMEMRIGERRIVGAVKEKKAAQKIYRAAKSAGKKASLVEQQRPNLFTNRVANIAPGEEVSVHLEYVQPVSYEHGQFSLRFPMTITPRYMPGTALAGEAAEEELVLNPYLGWATATDQVPDAAAISPVLNPTPGDDRQPINPIAITAELDMGMPLSSVSSAYHDIALSRSSGIYSIRLRDGVSEMDRDFLLTWEPVTGSAPQAALFTEKVGAEYFGLLMLVPPAEHRGGAELTREIVFVVDTSGSMGGTSIEQARASLGRALQQLRPRDRFNVIAFNSSYRMLYRTPMPATTHHIQHAQEFVRHLQASGGTEMLPALRAALSPPGEEDAHRDAAALRQVVFITDGAVGNEQALYEEIAQRLGGTRLFTVGIGSAPNSWFMRKAAQFGRGTHTHIGNLNEVGGQMARLFEQMSQPAVVDLDIQWPASVEAWPQRVPDLYLGQPLSVAVNFGTDVPTGEVTVSGRSAGTAWSRRLQVNAAVEGVSRGGVASVWARRKIESLMDGLVTGTSEDDVRAGVLPIALAHQLMSRYTSFVAVEEIIARPQGQDLKSRAVANTRPQGQSAQAFAYPRTATTGPAKLWFAMLALFAAMLIHVLRQEDADRDALAASH